MKPAPKLVLAAALLLVALGVGLAVLQPGSLGDDDAGTQTAQPAVTETETETETDTEVETGTETDGQVGAGGIDTPDDTTTTVVTTTTAATTPTTAGGSAAAPTTTAAAPSTSTTRPAGSVGGSGLDGSDDDVAADTEDGLANTGGTSTIGTVLVLGLAGLVLRRRTA